MKEKPRKKDDTIANNTNGTKKYSTELKSLKANTKDFNDCPTVENVPSKKRKLNENIVQAKTPKLSKFTHFNVEPIETDLKSIGNKTKINKLNKKKLEKKKKQNEFVVTEIEDFPSKNNGNSKATTKIKKDDSDSNEDDYIDQFFIGEDDLCLKENNKESSDGIVENYQILSEEDEMEDESKCLVPVSKRNSNEHLYLLDDESDDDYSFPSDDEYSDDYSDLSSISDYDIGSGEDESFDSGSFHTDSENESILSSDHTDDTYDRFMKGQYETDSDDSDFTSNFLFTISFYCFNQSQFPLQPMIFTFAKVKQI